MSIFTKRNQAVLLAALNVFLSSQMLPCLAQMQPSAPLHIPVITPPVIIGHQHIPILISSSFPGTIHPAGIHHLQLTNHIHNGGSFFPHHWLTIIQDSLYLIAVRLFLINLIIMEFSYGLI